MKLTTMELLLKLHALVLRAAGLVQDERSDELRVIAGRLAGTGMKKRPRPLLGGDPFVQSVNTAIHALWLVERASPEMQRSAERCMAEALSDVRKRVRSLGLQAQPSKSVVQFRLPSPPPEQQCHEAALRDLEALATRKQGVREALRYVGRELSNPPLQSTDAYHSLGHNEQAAEDTICALLRANNKLEAIKRLRAITGYSLGATKALIDSFDPLLLNEPVHLRNVLGRVHWGMVKYV